MALPHRRSCSTILAAAIAFGGMALACGGTQAVEAPRYVNASNVGPGHVAWIRSGPGVNYGKVGYIRATSRHIRTMECKTIARDNWCHILFEGTRGWIQDRYLGAPHVMRG